MAANKRHGLPAHLRNKISPLLAIAAEAGQTAIDLSGAEAAETLDLATPVGWAKWGWDAATFGMGLLKCW